MATKQASDKLSYGITLLIFGVLFLLDKIGLLSHIPYGEAIISAGVFFLIAGFVFIFTQPKKMLGWIFLIIGIILNADFFFGWISGYSYLLVPLALIIVGLFMILSSKRNR